jgi:hypothetical protein
MGGDDESGASLTRAARLRGLERDSEIRHRKAKNRRDAPTSKRDSLAAWLLQDNAA